MVESPSLTLERVLFCVRIVDEQGDLVSEEWWPLSRLFDMFDTEGEAALKKVRIRLPIDPALGEPSA